MNPCRRTSSPRWRRLPSDTSRPEVLEREDAAKEELTAEGVTFVDVDNAAFTEHFSGYAEANFPDLADWCNQIRALAPNA